MADFIQLADEVRDFRAFEMQALARLKQVVAFDASFFWHNGSLPTTVGFDGSRLASSKRADLYEVELAPIKRAALARRRVAIDVEVLGESVKSQSYYGDFMKPIGGQSSMLGYLALRGDVTGAVMLGRCSGSFTESDKLQLESALPALSVARASYVGRPSYVSRPLARETPTVIERLRDRFVPAVLGRAAAHSGNIVVRDRGGYREMVAQHGSSRMSWSRAMIADPSRSGWPYVDLFHLAAARASARERALFVGCGGVVAIRQFARVYPGISMDVVELEPAVIELARSFYALDDVPGVAVHQGDGIAFIANAEAGRWDIVIVDAYGAGDLPRGFSDAGFFAHVARALRAGGSTAINVVGRLASEGPVREVVRAASTAFDDVRIVPVIETGEHYSPSALRNVVIVASLEAALGFKARRS